MIFGDLLFTLGIPIPVRRLDIGRTLAKALLPIARNMPISFFYPQGKKQEVHTPKHGTYFEWADVVAGDFLLIKKFAPPGLGGKIVLTNTTTGDDRKMLEQAGVHKLITTTPRIEGRTFGANVLEGLLVAVLAGEGKEPSIENYPDVLKRSPIKPSIEILNAAGESP
jgi:hypothetical protein